MCNISRRDMRIVESRKSLAYPFPSFIAALFTMFTFTCMFTSNFGSGARRNSEYVARVASGEKRLWPVVSIV